MGEAVKGFFGDWFSTNGFTIWKLQTGWDFLFFGIIVAAGFLMIKGVIALFDRGRTPEKAAARVAARLRKLGGRGSAVYRNVDMNGDHYDMLWFTDGRLYNVKVFHFGMIVTGAANGGSWRLAFNKDVRTIPNPMPGMREQAVTLKRSLQQAGVKNAAVHSLLVFADNYGTPKLDLKGVDNAVTFRSLKDWAKSRKVKAIPGTMDPEKVKTVLTTQRGA